MQHESFVELDSTNWDKTRKRTAAAVKILTDFQQNGSIDVFFQGVPQQLPASQIIDKILFGQGLVDAHLGNPATNSTTPDIVVTLKPGYIWVGNVNNQHKNAEHGGFSPDDTHVALIVASGGLDPALKGTVQDGAVNTTQIAVTALEALGLDPTKLQGAVADSTTALPGFGLPVGVDPVFTEGQLRKNVVVATFNTSDPNALRDLVALINWGDGTQSAGHIVRVVPNKYEIVGSHTYKEEGNYVASVTLSDLKHHTRAIAGFEDKVVAPTTEHEGSLQDQIEDGFWTKLVSLKGG
jgi:hypothetical protein